MDGLSLYFTIKELSCLINGKIDKVQQPEKDAVLFSVRNNGRNYRLYVSVHAENGHIRLTENDFTNPAEPPVFCMLLRKKLTGGRITEIVQRGVDRYTVMRVLTKNDLDDPEVYELHIEIMGKYSNLTLVHEGTVADAIRRVSPGMSSVRLILPGIAFVPPPQQEKESPFAISSETLAAIASASAPASVLQRSVAGLSRDSAAMICSRCPDAQALPAFFSSLDAAPVLGFVITDEVGTPVAAYPFSPPDGYRYEVFPSLGAAYDHFYRTKERALSVSRSASGMRRTIELVLRRQQSKLSKYSDAIRESADAESLRLYGELLTANLYTMHRGQRAARVLNYYSDPAEEVIVPLDPLLTPNANAQAYYKKYRRKKAAGDYAEKMFSDVSDEIAFLEGQLDNLEKCESEAELGEIREEMIALGYIRPDRKKARSGKIGASAPMCFTAPDGSRVYVGKNNRQNELLTLKRAQSENMWLHVKNIPGSHVIIDPPGMPNEDTLQLAALLAAYFSKARGSAQVPVDYTFRKNIKKPAGSKPGTVIYSTNRTLYVTPDRESVQPILNQRKEDS